MADTFTRNVISRFGFETTPGVLPVAEAAKRPTTWSIAPVPQINQRPIRPIGNEYRSSNQRGLEWSDLTIVGGEGATPSVDFIGINYPLEFCYGTVTPTESPTGVWRRVYTPGAALGRTFALDYGDPLVYLKRTLYNFLTQLTFNATLDELTFGGSGKGKTIAAGVTGAASPTDILLVTPNPTTAGLYLASSLAGLGTVGASTGGALMSRFFGFTLDTGVRADVLSPILPTNTSWTVQKPMSADGSASIILGSDTNAWAYLANIQNNTTFYFRYEVIGPIITGTSPYIFAIDGAVQFDAHFNLQDQEGLDAVELPLTLIQNSSLTGVRFTTQTGVATL